jgi:site-specific DNA-methyltransferase (adenine-specific)
MQHADFDNGSVLLADAQVSAEALPDGETMLIWTDPPFGTNKEQRVLSTGKVYADGSVYDILELLAKLAPIWKRKLADNGTLAVCLDYRAVHECYALLVAAGFEAKGEIIWHFELGRGTSKWWTNKHNTVLLFGTGKAEPKFNSSAVPTTHRKAPKEGYAKTKPVASVWTITLSNTDPERIGYPNQKPLRLVRPFIEVHTDEGDLVHDGFCGSGTVAIAASASDRRFLVGDRNPVAFAATVHRIEESESESEHGEYGGEDE